MRLDVNKLGKSIKNTALLEAMKALRAEENHDNLRSFFKEVTNAVFIVPAKFDNEPVPDENGRVRFEGNVKVNFVLLTNDKGDKVLPCFTDDETIAASQFGSEFRRVILPYERMSKVVLGSNGAIKGIAVNPFTENCLISDEFLRNYEENKENMNSNIQMRTFKGGDKVKLRTPKYKPVQMLEEASKFLRDYPQVSRAFLQMFDDGESDDKYLIVIETAAKERPIFEKMLPVIKPYAFGMDIVFMNTKSMIGWKVTTITEPFYVREGYVPVTAKKPVDDTEHTEEDIIAEDEE